MTCCGKQFETKRQEGGATPVGEKPEVPDAHKPLGKTCRKKRRRNSSTPSRINRFLFLCAESRHRKVTLPCSKATSRWFEIATRCV